jgi:hypothetical protein
MSSGILQSILRGLSRVLSPWKLLGSWNLGRAFQFSLILAVVLTALSVSYYLVIFSPRKEESRKREEQTRNELRRREVEAKVREAEAKTRLETARVALDVIKENQKIEEQEAKKILLDDCLNDSYKTYLLNWAIASKTETQRRAAEIRSGGVTTVVNCTVARVDPNICRALAESVETSSHATLSNHKPFAPLPSVVASSLDADLYHQRDACFRRYPQS